MKTKIYTVGTHCFCDFHFGGKPKGRVVAIKSPGDGKGTERGEIVVQLTETVGAYKKGERLTLNAWQAVPLAQELKRKSFFRHVSTLYRYE